MRGAAARARAPRRRAAPSAWWRGCARPPRAAPSVVDVAVARLAEAPISHAARAGAVPRACWRRERAAVPILLRGPRRGAGAGRARRRSSSLGPAAERAIDAALESASTAARAAPPARCSGACAASAARRACSAALDERDPELRAAAARALGARASRERAAAAGAPARARPRRTTPRARRSVAALTDALAALAEPGPAASPASREQTVAAARLAARRRGRGRAARDRARARPDRPARGHRSW